MTRQLLLFVAISIGLSTFCFSQGTTKELSSHLIKFYDEYADAVIEFADKNQVREASVPSTAILYHLRPTQDFPLEHIVLVRLVELSAPQNKRVATWMLVARLEMEIRKVTTSIEGLGSVIEVTDDQSLKDSARDIRSLLKRHLAALKEFKDKFTESMKSMPPGETGGMDKKLLDQIQQIDKRLERIRNLEK